MSENEVQDYLRKRNFAAFQPKVVLFDMDGVLYNSMPHHAIAWKGSMRSFGLDITKADVYAAEGIRGVDTIRMMVKRQQGHDISEEETQKMYDEEGRPFHQMSEASISDGVLSLMNKIKKSGLSTNIVTGNTQRKLTKRLVNDLHHFVSEENIATAYNIKHRKPASDPYLKGLQLTGNHQPWEGIVVENVPIDIRVGVAAQIFAVVINSDPLPDGTLRKESADPFFHQMTESRAVWEQLSDVAKHA